MAKRVVLGIFPNEAGADAAAASLKSTGLAKGDAIGVLVLDGDGEIKTDKVGSNSAGKGAGIGIVLSLLGPIGLVGGAVGGSLLGMLHHKGLGLRDDDRDRISRELQGGKAAVGVLAESTEAESISAHLSALGGVPEVHEATEEALDEAVSAAPTA